MSGRPNLLTEDPARALRALAVPTLLGIVFILAVNLIDTYFVGQLGTDELAAMGFTFPVATLVTSVGFGLSVGTTSAVSRALGAGETRSSARLVTHGLLLGTLVVLFISVLGVLSQRMLFRWLGADETLLPLLEAYMTIWYAGAVFLVIPMIGTGALRASGDAKTPAVIMAIAALSNVVLDPVLIFGFGPIPAMGIRGAAIGTVLSRAVTLVTAVAILHRRALLDWHIPSARELGGSWKRILSVGIPASITNAITPVATAVLTAMIASYGAQAVAGYGVASRLESFVLIPSMALTAALTPFIGQNWGAQQHDRVATAVRSASRFVLGWGVGAWIVLLTFGDIVAGVFTDDARVIDVVHLYMWIVPAGYGAAGFVSVISASFNAVDRAIRSTVLSALRALVLAVPLAIVGGSLGGLRGVFLGLALASLGTALAAMLWSKSLRAVPKPVDDPLGHLRGAGERLPWIKALITDAEAIEGLSICPRPINTLGFYVHRQEVGHVHASGHIDLHMPQAVHDALLALGHCEHHRHLHDAGWITHRIDDVSDVDPARWLLRLSAKLHLWAAAEFAPSEVQARKELQAMEIEPVLREAICKSLRHATAA